MCQEVMAQPYCVAYFREINVAKYESFKGETAAAIKRFEKANVNYVECTDAASKLPFIKMYIEIGDKKTAYELLVQELKKGYKLESLQYVGIFQNNLGNYYDSLLFQEDSLHQLFYASLNQDMFLFVHSMFSMDQRIFYVSSIQDSLRSDIRHQIFRDNIAKLVAYVEENGIIGYKDLGHYQSWVTVILMHHRLDDSQDYENVEYLIEKYKIAIEKGYSQPEVVLNLYDNMAEIIDGGKLQLSGKFYSPKSKKFLPFIDIEIVDSLRLSLGLNTLREFSEMRGVSLPDGYK